MADRFSSADPPEIALLAYRRAQLTVPAGWQDKRGLLANRQRGVPYPAVGLHERVRAAVAVRGWVSGQPDLHVRIAINTGKCWCSWGRARRRAS